MPTTQCTSEIRRAGRLRMRSDASFLVPSFSFFVDLYPSFVESGMVRLSVTLFVFLSVSLPSSFRAPSYSFPFTDNFSVFIYSFFSLDFRCLANSIRIHSTRLPQRLLPRLVDWRPPSISFFGNLMTSPFLASVLQLVRHRALQGSAARSLGLCTMNGGFAASRLGGAAGRARIAVAPSAPHRLWQFYRNHARL
ncbi:hypothetical protein B0H14DRAFT_1472973 [Mycena olivaceomarginata]|nr:hypothetical protein B0H14DRAFT_1472973 [Mycena olivaceomarginata]